MVHTINVKGKEYHVVTTTFTAYGVETFIQVNVDVSKLSNQDKLIIKRNANLIFNRPLKITNSKPQPTQAKPWWKFW